MAELRSQRMQVVLVVAERKEQQAGREFGQCKAQVEAEAEQLRQLDDYAAQYLRTYSERKTAIKPQELIAYSGFIQRLGDARKEQQARLNRMQASLEKYQQAWQLAYHKREAIKTLITRLQVEEGAMVDKQLQKELDELVGQAYLRQRPEN